MGYEPKDVLAELNWCAKYELITTDKAGNEGLVETDVVRAHASAFVHTTLLADRIDYLANCMLTMKVFDQGLAGKISATWSNTAADLDITYDRKRELVGLLRDYVTYWSGRRENLFPISKDIGRAPTIILEGIEKSLTRPLHPQPPLPFDRQKRRY
jgi:hypothetical protein